MATKITTIRAILDELNGAGNNRPWALLPGLTFVSAASVTPPYRVNVSTDGLVLKAFIKTTTGEVKFFLAKWTDEPETDQLP